MAKRKKKKDSIWSRLAFWKPKKKTRRGKKDENIARIRTIATILGAVIVLSGVAVGLVYLNRYVQSISSNRQVYASLILSSPPNWVSASSTLQSRIATAAGGTSIMLTDETTRAIASRLEAMPWMYNVKVQTKIDAEPEHVEPLRTLQINAKYRKPVAMIQQGDLKYYVAWVEKDDPLYDASEKRIVLLDYVPLEGVICVEITGFKSRPPHDEGQLWKSGEVISAVELLAALGRMDSYETPQKPLLDEIATIDLTNYHGRKDSKESQIVMVTKQGVEVWWGAPYSESARYAEATEREKIGSLYKYFEDHGSLSKHKFIDLRIAQVIFPRPME